MMTAVSTAEGPRAWSAPQFDGRVASPRRGARSVGELGGAEQRVWKEAEEAGRAAGLAAAQAEIAARHRALDAQSAALQSALLALSRPLAKLDDDLHEQVARLAIAIARNLVRRELRMDPAQVIGIVRDTVALLPASSRGVRVVLHPEDAGLLRERLALPQSAEAWSVVEDPVLSRGDCRVVSEYAQVDARLDTRIAAAMSELLGDERQAPRDGEDA